MNPLIQCSHVDFGYENQDAVVDVTMDVNPGEYVCIVGENGSGKSTLMKGLLGLLERDRLSASADCGPKGFSGNGP